MSRPFTPDFLLFASIIGFTFVWVVFGGSELDNLFLFGILAVAGTCLTAVVTVSGAPAIVFAEQRFPVLLLALLVLAIPIIQLVPLPPGLWQALPGRMLATVAVTDAGLGTAWRPLTLSVTDTLETALACLWLLALAIGVARLSTERVRQLFAFLFAMTLTNVLVGFVQTVSRGALLTFYPPEQGSTLLGFYVNKNHAALIIATGFLTGYAAFRPRRSTRASEQSYFRLAFLAPVVLLMLAALIATNSRAGLVFGLTALTFAALNFWDRQVGTKVRLLAIGILVLFVVAVVFSSSDIVARSLGRFSTVGSDIRWDAWRHSMALVRLYMPVGAGVGSFVPLYQTIEQVSWLRPEYLNHVHNDYIEQLIELGAIAPALWAVFLWAVVPPTIAAWRLRTRSEGVLALAGAGIVLLFLIHSGFDYPLRRPGAAVVFVIALAVLLRSTASPRLARQAKLCEASAERSA